VWLLAIAVTAAVFATGGRVTSPAIHAFVDGAKRNQQAALNAAARRIRLGFRLELAGITAVLVLMSVLRSL
jgi:hypothetical protein